MSTPNSPRSSPLPITAEWLAETLRSEVLKSSQRIPTNEPIAKLARVINNISATYHLDQFRILRSSSFMKFKDELELFLAEYSPPDGLPGLEGDLAAAGQRFADSAEELTRLIVNYRGYGLAGGKIVRTKAKSWRDIAGPVATAFIFSPLGRGFGVSNDGPLARFVKAVVSHITGENPSIHAVGIHLRRLATVAKIANRDMP